MVSAKVLPPEQSLSPCNASHVYGFHTYGVNGGKGGGEGGGGDGGVAATHTPALLDELGLVPNPPSRSSHFCVANTWNLSKQQPPDSSVLASHQALHASAVRVSLLVV